MNHLEKLPLSLRGPVLKELKRMEADRVIEQINGSPSIFNLVAQEKDGSVRLCIGIKSSNIKYFSWGLSFTSL